MKCSKINILHWGKLFIAKNCTKNKLYTYIYLSSIENMYKKKIKNKLNMQYKHKKISKPLYIHI